MSFRFQKRIGLGKGLGVNISKSGLSTSYRTRHGSIGTRGVSLKTGVPGLSWRTNWGGKNAGLIGLILLLSVGLFILLWNTLRIIIHLLVRGLRFIWQIFFSKNNNHEQSIK